MTQISIISKERFDPSKFVVDDFYDTTFSYGLNVLLLYLKELDTDNEMILESFKNEDYVKINILCNNEPYTIYHCFAGDNPSGLITKDRTVLEQIGEAVKKLNVICDDPNVSLIEKWYYEITEECCNYEHDFWYAEEKQE